MSSVVFSSPDPKVLDKKPKEENLKKILLNARDIKERNKLIVEC